MTTPNSHGRCTGTVLTSRRLAQRGGATSAIASCFQSSPLHVRGGTFAPFQTSAPEIIIADICSPGRWLGLGLMFGVNVELLRTKLVQGTWC